MAITVQGHRRFFPGVTPPASGKLSRMEREQLHAQCEAAGQLIYVPNENTTGLLPGTDPLNDLVPLGTGTVHGVPWGTTPLTNRMVWGGLNPSTASSSTISNSYVAGPRPDLMNASSGIEGCIREPSNNVFNHFATDSVFSVLFWTMPELDPPGGAWDLEETLFLARNSIGIRGGRYNLLNCEVFGVQDGFHQVTAWRGAGDPVASSRRHCWVHHMLFYRGAGHSQPEGTHSDIDQWHRFMNHVSEYNLFGGPLSDVSGYDLNPARETSDGARNAGSMVQQESGIGDNYRIRDILYRRNLYWQHTGNGWNINHHYATAFPNAMDTVTFEDNMHVVRGDGKYIIANLAQYADRHFNHRRVTINDGVITDVGAVTLSSGS